MGLKYQVDLTQVSVNGDGNHVWGVDSDNKIYYRNGKDDSDGWTQIPGTTGLTHVSVSGDDVRTTLNNSKEYTTKISTDITNSGRIISIVHEADGDYKIYNSIKDSADSSGEFTDIHKFDSANPNKYSPVVKKGFTRLMLSG